MKFTFTILGLAISAVAWGHHSFAAEYDSTKVVKLTGAITKVDWSNPHVYFYIDVKDDATLNCRRPLWRPAASPCILRRTLGSNPARRTQGSVKGGAR
jgi:hypothetical protein